MNKSKIEASEDRFQARNWKQYTERQIQKLHPVQRSKYLAYETASDQDGIRRTKVRVHEEHKKMRVMEKEKQLFTDQRLTRRKQDNVMGQLKASEANQRVKNLNRIYQCNKTSEINHLIYTQPTAIKAVRLQSLLPPIPTRIKFKDNMIKEQRMRIEVLMEDEIGLETNRILC